MASQDFMYRAMMMYFAHVLHNITPSGTTAVRKNDTHTIDYAAFIALLQSTEASTKTLGINVDMELITSIMNGETDPTKKSPVTFQVSNETKVPTVQTQKIRMGTSQVIVSLKGPAPYRPSLATKDDDLRCFIMPLLAIYHGHQVDDAAAMLIRYSQVCRARTPKEGEETKSKIQQFIDSHGKIEVLLQYLTTRLPRVECATAGGS